MTEHQTKFEWGRTIQIRSTQIRELTIIGIQ